jgi:hypothetical protein
MISVVNEYGFDSEEANISHFNGIDGTALYKMSKAEFMCRESQHGDMFHHSLQQLKQEQDQMAYDVHKREFFSSILYVKVVCMLHVQYKTGKWGWLQWYAMMLMLLDKFNFQHQFSLPALL